MELDKLICSKCGEEFPATTERGPGPAKAKFAAHVNKCEGKKAEVGEEVNAEFFVDAEPLKVGDQVMLNNGPIGQPVMFIEEIDGEEALCRFMEGEETIKDLWVLAALHRVPATLEGAPPECAPVEITVIKETLKVPLSDEDYKDFAIKMGHANLEISAAEDSLASVKSQFKARIDAAVAKRNEYASIINAGCEYKPVECQLRKDYARSTIEVVRMDTYMRVSIRNMTSGERQRGLDFMERQAEAQWLEKKGNYILDSREQK